MLRRHVRVGDDTVVCYWANSSRADPFLDALAALIDSSDEGEVSELALESGPDTNKRIRAKLKVATDVEIYKAGGAVQVTPFKVNDRGAPFCAWYAPLQPSVAELAGVHRAL